MPDKIIFERREFMLEDTIIIAVITTVIVILGLLSIFKFFLLLSRISWAKKYGYNLTIKEIINLFFT